MNLEPNKLIELFRGILLISEQMVGITEKANDEDDHTSELTNLIAKREELIRMIDEVEVRLEDGEDYLSARDKLVIKQIIKEIQANDNKVSTHLKKQMLVVREKIGTVKQNKKAQDAYLGNDEPADGWFFDSKK